MYIVARVAWICDVFYPSLAKQCISFAAVMCFKLNAM